MIELPPGVKREPLSKGKAYPSPARWAALELALIVHRLTTESASVADERRD